MYHTTGSDKAMVLLLIGILKIGLEDHNTARDIIMNAYKFDSELINSYLDGQTVTITPFCANSKYA